MSRQVKVVVNTDDRATLQELQGVLAAYPVEVICDPADCREAPLCRWVDPQALNDCGQLTAGVLDAIETLEQTRHAFRSGQLASLRRRLEKLLQTLPEAGC